jgi:hypothetical protein
MLSPLCLTVYGITIAVILGLAMLTRKSPNSQFHFTRRWQFISISLIATSLIWISPITLVRDIVFCAGIRAPSIDVIILEQLLQASQWQEADKETSWMLRLASGNERKIEPTLETVNHLPCADLQAIDQLWVHYSQGRFGFSTQRKIYERVVLEGGSKYILDIMKRVDNLTKYRQKQFNLNAPFGHLPSSGILLSTPYINHAEYSIDDLAKRQHWCGL